jgi:hypothetical protein
MSAALLRVDRVSKHFGGARGALRLGTCAVERAKEAARSIVTDE